MAYADSYQDYRNNGWLSVLPLAPNTKFPPPKGYTGYNAHIPSGADCWTWAETEPDGNICIRLPEGIIGIDVDAYGAKTGAATLRHAENLWGPLPDTYTSTSRNDGISGIRPYRIPEGIALATVLTFPEKGWGHIEIVQWFHRYMVCAPSTHPEGGTYRWLAPNGTPTTTPHVDEIPELPQRWIDALQATTTTTTTPTTTANVTNTLAHLPAGTPDSTVTQRTNQAITDLATNPGSRHDNTLKHVLALLRYAADGRPGIPTALQALHNVWMKVMGPERGETGAQLEWDRMVAGQRGHDLIASTPSVDPATEEADLLWLAGLTDEFWETRTSLTRIRDFAHARWCSPWAVLGVTLCRTAISIPRWVYLPPLRGGKPGASLNTMVALVGVPGAGKDTANDAAAELFPLDPQTFFDAGGLGSGEGVAKSYGSFTEQVISDPGEKPVLKAQVWQWVNERHATLFFDSEVEKLRAHADRGGASLLPVLCAAVMGQSQLTAWADKTKCPPVTRLTYRFAYAVGAQPEKADWITGSGDTGLPQRFLWVPATDPTIPTIPPDEPAPFPPYQWPASGETVITVPDTVREVVATEALAASRGAPITPAHHTLTRMKVAYLLHVLECVETGKTDEHSLGLFTEKDWELSGMVMAKSALTLGAVESVVAEGARKDNEYKGRAEGKRKVAAEDAVSESVESRAGARILAALATTPDGLTKRECRKLFPGSNSPGKAKRDAAPGVLDRMHAEGRLSLVDGRYRIHTES